MKTGTVALAAMLCMFAAGADAVDYLVNEPGRWSAWKFRAEPFTRRAYGASGADLTAFEAELRALDALIRRASAVAHPVGFSAQTWGNLSGYAAQAPGQPKGDELPLGGGLTFGAFSIFSYERNGKTIREDGGETELLQFVVNDIQPPVLDGRVRPYEWEDVDTDAFVQPQEKDAVSGFPRYGNIIVIKKRPAPVWVPVPVEQALRLVIAAEQKKRRYLVETHGSEAAIKRIEEKIASVEAHIASLRPEDRGAPSCWTARGNGGWGQRFQIGAGPDCRPLVRPNWEYFDRRLPRSTPQVLVIFDVARCYEGRQVERPGGCATNRRLLDTIDRQALLDWLH